MINNRKFYLRIFTRQNNIYTRFICSLSEAQILSKGHLEEMGLPSLEALATAAMNRQASSFDLVFEA